MALFVVSAKWVAKKANGNQLLWCVELIDIV